MNSAWPTIGVPKVNFTVVPANAMRLVPWRANAMPAANAIANRELVANGVTSVCPDSTNFPPPAVRIVVVIRLDRLTTRQTVHLTVGVVHAKRLDFD